MESLAKKVTSSLEYDWFGEPDCIRKVPEFLGYGSNSDYIMGGLVVCLIAATSALCCTVLCSSLKMAFTREVQVEDERYRELQSTSLGSQREPLRLGVSDVSTLPSFETRHSAQDFISLEEPLLGRTMDSIEDTGQIASTRGGADELHPGWKYIPRIGRLHTPYCVRAMHCCTRWMCGILVGLVLSMTVILVVLSPKEPAFSVCASKHQWSQILYDLAHLHFEADIDIVISIYNPNHVDLTMVHMVGDFKYKESEIGTFEYTPTSSNSSFQVPAGSVYDLEFTAKFSPGIATASRMFLDYEEGILELSVEADVKVSIDASQLKIYEVNYHLPEYSFTMNDLETEYCKICT